jgi:hypothetical protein
MPLTGVSFHNETGCRARDLEPGRNALSVLRAVGGIAAKPGRRHVFLQTSRPATTRESVVAPALTMDGEKIAGGSRLVIS